MSDTTSMTADSITPNEKVAFKLRGPLTHEVSARTRLAYLTSSDVAERDLQRYYELITFSLNSIDLTEGEAALIVDVLNGTLFMPSILSWWMIEASIEHGVEDGLAEKWEVDGAALVAKVHTWSASQRLAVCDAVERYWSGGTKTGTLTETLSAVGLIRRDPPTAIMAQDYTTGKVYRCR